MNYFSSDEFLRTVAEVYYPGQGFRIASVQVADSTYRLLVLQGKRVVASCPFLDFFEPLSAAAGDAASLRWPFLPRVCHGVLDAEAWQSQTALHERYQPAPYIDWQKFASGGWPAFLSAVKARSPFPFGVTQRKARKLAREVGPLRCEFVAAAPEAVLNACMEWKSAQYRESNYIDLFVSPNNQRLFHEQQRRGLLSINALYAGDVLVAGHAGVIWNNRFYYWLSAHDRRFNAYSPGTLLLEHLLQQSHAAGHREFDFLLGGEAYKWNFATDTRLVGHGGQEALHRRVWPPVRRFLMTHIREQPRLYGFLQRAKRTLKERELL